MKKTLLLSTLLVSVLTVCAQVSRRETDMPLVRYSQHIGVLDMPMAVPQCSDDATAAVPVRRKSVADGVYFTRPWGTFYRSNLSWTGFTGSILKVPGATDVVLTNHSAHKENTHWTISKDSSTPFTNIDAEGNAVIRGVRANGLVYTLPALHADGAETFCLGLDVDRMFYEPTDTFQLMTLQDTRYTYSGFNDGCFFGLYGKETTWNITVNGVTRPGETFRLIQQYPEPLRPFCLHSLQFTAQSMKCTADDPHPIFKDDACLDIYFIGRESGDTLGHMTATAYDTLSYTYNATLERGVSVVQVAQTEEDWFGNQTVKPIILDEAFTLVMEGFDREGVECGIYMTAQANLPWERHDIVSDAIVPTRVQPKYTDEEGGYRYAYDNITSGYYQFTAGTRSYSMVNYLNGFFDVVDVVAGDSLTAPAAGGRCTFESGGTAYIGPQYQSTRPYIFPDSRTPNYTVEGLPGWLTVEGNFDNNYNTDNAWINILSLQAEPLPEGVAGRKAELTIVSEYGARSEIVTVVQGDATSITTIDNKSEGTGNGTAYNLAGQRVNSAYTGVVIDGGKKIIRK